MKKVVLGVGLLVGALQAQMAIAQGSVAAPPAMPSNPLQQMMPMGAAPINAPVMPQATPSAGNTSDLGQTLRIINERRAQIELLKLDAELLKAKEPFMEMMNKQREATKAVEDEAKKNELAKIKAEADAAAVKAVSGAVVGAVGAIASVTVEPSISVLSIYGLENNLMATVKVDDMVLNVKKGDKLPSGYMVKAINFENVEIVKEVGTSKKKKELKQDTLYVSGSDAAAIYAARGKSGVVPAAGATKPAEASRTSGVSQPANSLPPLPVSAR